jgi:hypothetical protein
MSGLHDDWKQRRNRFLIDGIPRTPREFLKSLVVLGALRDLGWHRSSRERRSVTRDGVPTPWLTYPALAWLNGRASRIRAVVEFGAGASTLWFLANGAEVVSLEHDEAWLTELETMLPSTGRELVRVSSDEVGYLQGLERDSLWRFDLILVDGLHREACVQAVLPHVREDALLCLDDSQRRDYASIIDALHGAGFKSVGFRGLAPIVGELKETRFFSRSLHEWLDPL